MEELEISRRNMKKSGRWGWALLGAFVLSGYGTYKYFDLDKVLNDSEGIYERHNQVSIDLTTFNEMKRLNKEADNKLINLDNLQSVITNKEEELKNIENNPTYQTYVSDFSRSHKNNNLFITLLGLEGLTALLTSNFIRKHYMKRASVEIDEYKKSKEIGVTE